MLASPRFQLASVERTVVFAARVARPTQGLIRLSCVCCLAQGTKYSVRIRKVSANGGLWSEEAVFDTPKSANNDMSINSRSLNSSMNYGSMKYGAPAGSLSMNASINYDKSTPITHGYAGQNSSMINDRCACLTCPQNALRSPHLSFFHHLYHHFDPECLFGFQLHFPSTFSLGSRTRPSQKLAADKGNDG